MLSEQDKDKIKLFFIIIAIILISLIAINGKSQSILIDNNGRAMIAFSEEEKAIKISSSIIASKEDNRWETHLNGVKIMWEIKYIKASKLYLLYKNHIKYYESTTISGIRSKYGSDLLGRDIKVQ